MIFDNYDDSDIVTNDNDSRDINRGNNINSHIDNNNTSNGNIKIYILGVRVPKLLQHWLLSSCGI